MVIIMVKLQNILFILIVYKYCHLGTDKLCKTDGDVYRCL